ncbi:MAG: HigA family addiction module antitoxin [Bacteriovorax sp.]|nr:HigA family addiction module antitoxin [Bacteriovorax sp.]
MEKLKRQKIERKPSHPGEILKNIWLDELNYTQSGFAALLSAATDDKIKVSTMQTKLSEIINGKRAMSADFAVLLGRVLDTSPRMWMNLQVNLDIWEAEKNAA